MLRLMKENNSTHDLSYLFFNNKYSSPDFSSKILGYWKASYNLKEIFLESKVAALSAVIIPCEVMS